MRTLRTKTCGVHGQKSVCNIPGVCTRRCLLGLNIHAHRKRPESIKSKRPRHLFHSNFIRGLDPWLGGGGALNKADDRPH